MDTMFNPAWLVCLDSTHSCDVTVSVLVLLDIRTYRQTDEKSARIWQRPRTKIDFAAFLFFS
jgi:hypothetical protein